MPPSENCYDGVPLQPLWLSLVHRLGAACGALVALTALLAHVPLRVAALRGGLAWLAVLLCGRLVAHLARLTQRSATPARPTRRAAPTAPVPGPQAEQAS